MSSAAAGLTELKAEGRGTCAGGQHPDPPLDDYPLLVWTQDHPAFGRMVVHTEDQKASVHDIAVAFVETPSIEAVAARIGTSEAHAEQAVRYADEWRKLNAAS